MARRVKDADGIVDRQPLVRRFQLAVGATWDAREGNCLLELIESNKPVEGGRGKGIAGWTRNKIRRQPRGAVIAGDARNVEGLVNIRTEHRVANRNAGGFPGSEFCGTD